LALQINNFVSAFFIVVAPIQLVTYRG